MEKKSAIPEKIKQIFCLILAIVLIVGYVLYHAVPWFDTFGKGYSCLGYRMGSSAPLLGPDSCLTLDGRLLTAEPNYDGSYDAKIGGWGYRRIHLNPLTFDRYFADAQIISMETVVRIREECKAAWIGWHVDENGVAYLQYLLKQTDGSIYIFPMVLCCSSKYGDDLVRLRLSSCQGYVLHGTAEDFYDFIQKAVVIID